MVGCEESGLRCLAQRGGLACSKSQGHFRHRPDPAESLMHECLAPTIQFFGAIPSLHLYMVELGLISQGLSMIPPDDSNMAPRNLDTSASLLLPSEIRREILRSLLLCPVPIAMGASPRNLDLHTQILGANRQLHMEGADVFYGENQFQMNIYRSGYREERATFLNCTHFGEQMALRLPQYSAIRNCAIHVMVDHAAEYWIVQSAVEKVVHALSDYCTPRHMQFTVEGRDMTLTSSSACVLRHFAWLPRISQVDILDGVKPRYARYLKDLIEGNPLADYFARMYHALEQMAESSEEAYFDYVQDARTAMEDDNMEAFKLVRAELIKRMIERTACALNTVYEHDGDAERQEEWVIEQRGKKRKRSDSL